MKTRVLSGLVMAPLLVLVYLGGWFIWAAAVFVSIVGLKEFYKGFEASGAKPCFNLGYVAVALLYLIPFLPTGQELFVMLWFFLVTVASMVYGFKVNERKLEDMTSTLLGIMYCGFLPFHIVLIDQAGYGALIWLVFFSAFGTDIMAYFTGMAIGKHRLCPNLSPKKSVEGAVGGVVGAALLGVLYALAVNRFWEGASADVLQYAIICAASPNSGLLNIYRTPFLPVNSSFGNSIVALLLSQGIYC